MNNPPEIAQDPAEHEEYAHGVHQHVTRYLIVGGLLLFFTLLTVALSYVDFGGFFSWLFHIHVAPQTSSKLNITVAIIVAAFKVSLVALIFMHLAAEKRLIYRVLIFTGFFVLGLFWLTFLAWYNPIVR
ncbi:MAG TPA: cytochrome C oxidase subunit IV family protein [Chthoniobacterales bacterium]|jgi:caa(3)-type oxidase subunit IV